MNWIKIFVLLSLPLTVFGQVEKHKIEILYSNNGNISREINQFYFHPTHEYGPGDDVFSYHEMSYKLNLYYAVVLKQNWEFGITGGYGRRVDRYDIANNPNWNGDKCQRFYSVAISSKFNFQFDRFEFASGFEIPISIFSEHQTNYFQNDLDQKAHYRLSVSGGFGLGINSLSSMSFNIKDGLYAITKISFGFHHLNTGGTLKYELISQTSNNLDNILYEIPSIFKKNYFSSPDLQIGIGWRF